MNAIRVLLAEEGSAMGRQLRDLLYEKFAVVGLVQDGHSLVRAALQLLPDAVVTDVDLPGLNGLDAVAQLRCARPVLGVVFVTAHAQPQMVARAMAMGPCSYVLKADAGEDLILAVDAAVQGEAFVSRSVRRFSTPRGPGPRSHP